MNNNTTKDEPYIEYMFTNWGEIIYGTKEQIKKLIPSIKTPFLGEVGCTKKRTIRVVDPRGFDTRIESANYRGGGVFVASISYPDRERDWNTYKLEPYTEGVKIRRSYFNDDYLGNKQALVNAGLVSANNLPGLPNMPKSVLTISPEGKAISSLDKGLLHQVRKQQATKVIKKVSNNKFEVSIRISESEINARRNYKIKLEAEWERRIADLPRPAPLHKLAMTQRRFEKNAELRSIQTNDEIEESEVWETADRAIEIYKTRGLIKDTGLDDAKKLMSDSVAVFQIGEYGLYRETDGEVSKVEIIGGYSVYRVRSDVGRFYDEGGRFDYLYGYTVKRWGDGEEFYLPPHQLFDKDFKLKHVRLVKNAKLTMASVC